MPTGKRKRKKEKGKHAQSGKKGESPNPQVIGDAHKRTEKRNKKGKRKRQRGPKDRTKKKRER